MPHGQRFGNANRPWPGEYIYYSYLAGVYSLGMKFQRNLANFTKKQAFFLFALLCPVLFKFGRNGSTEPWEVFVEERMTISVFL